MLFKKILVWTLSIYLMITLFISSQAQNYMWTIAGSQDTIETNGDVKSEEKNTSNSLNLECESAILIEQHSGQILYEHNIHEQLRPASVTKIMSILLIMEEIEQGRLSYEDKIACSETARAMGGSQIWLDTTETLTVNEMLKAICVVSANDCVVAMAEHIAGSQEAFVEKMNEKAKQLGMNDTTFKNCHGIDEDGHITSAYDISLMSKELLNKYPEITKYTTIWMDSLRDGKSQLVNTNKLIRNYKGATGLKTGSTSLALYNLSASATRDNLSLIAVVMKAPTTKVRFADAQKLLDYGFSKFSFKQFAKKGDKLNKINVTKGVESGVDVQYSEDAGCLIEKGKENQIEQTISLETLTAPICKGQKVGEAVYTLNNNELSKIDLIAAKDVEKINIFTMSKSVIYKWINLNRT
jgi:D-alanyl-D-alanine carboxypeptidase (penicillin-binding protein 5/6)